MTNYICPMHPDQHSDKPGSCPKCGMILAPERQGSTTRNPESEKPTTKR